MKICSGCDSPKEEDNFRKNKKKEDGLDNHCKTCRREKDKQTYNKNLEKSRKDGARYKQLSRIKRKEIVLTYLEKHPCIDCGEKDPVVLEFDHIKDKKYNVSTLINQGISLKILLKEMNKCEIRCANCHRRKTAKDFKFYKLTCGEIKANTATCLVAADKEIEQI